MPGPKPGQSNWEAGPVFRLGIGMISEVAQDPIIFAPGFYLARHLRTGTDGSGWSFLAGYSRSFILNLETADGDPMPGRNRFRFGIGWYQ